MSIEQNSIEFSLAAKKISSLEKQGFGRFVCIRTAAKLLIGQGFTNDHSYKVAEAAFELVFSD